MTRRNLSPEERDLWQRVARTTHRLHPDRPVVATPVLKHTPRKPEKPVLEPFEIGSRSKGERISLAISDTLATTPITMDRKAFNKLKRGKIAPEGRIDLHGKTVEQAHLVLTSFIMRAHLDGKRLVLVITGKGKRSDDHGPIPVRRGILRHSVPHWLSLPPLTQVVQQVSETHLKHGGGGAYYVYLRRSR